MEIIDGEPVLDRPSVAEVEAWFETASADTRAVWLRLTRKGVEPASLSSDELVDVGLCFGWPYAAEAMRRPTCSATPAGALAPSGPGSTSPRSSVSPPRAACGATAWQRSGRRRLTGVGTTPGPDRSQHSRSGPIRCGRGAVEGVRIRGVSGRYGGAGRGTERRGLTWRRDRDSFGDGGGGPTPDCEDFHHADVHHL